MDSESDFEGMYTYIQTLKVMRYMNVALLKIESLTLSTENCNSSTELQTQVMNLV